MRATNRICSTVFSLEALLAIFCFLGPVKHHFDWLAFDFTLIIIILLLSFSSIAGFRLYVFGNWALTRPSIAAIWLIAAFSLYSIISFSWSAGGSYAWDKLLYFVLLTLPSFLVALLFCSQESVRIERFIICVLMLGILGLWDVFTSLSWTQPLGSTTGIEAGYLGLGRVIGVSLAIILVLSTFIPQPAVRFGFLFVGLLLFFALLIIGARGALVGSLTASFLAVVLAHVRITVSNLWVTRVLLVAIISSLVCILLGVLATVFSPDLWGALQSEFRGIRRFNVLFSEGGQSALRRLEAYRLSLELIGLNPIFGSGFGSWYILADYAGLLHPHNVFLEVIVEMGLIGLSLFILLLGVTIWQMFPVSRIRSDWRSISILCMFLFAFINVNITGDLHENRYFFAILGLMFFIARQGRKLPQTGDR